MLVIILQVTNPVRDIDDKTVAVIFFVVLFLWDFKFHFGSVFKIIKLE